MNGNDSINEQYGRFSFIYLITIKLKSIFIKNWITSSNRYDFPLIIWLFRSYIQTCEQKKKSVSWCRWHSSNSYKMSVFIVKSYKNLSVASWNFFFSSNKVRLTTAKRSPTIHSVCLFVCATLVSLSLSLWVSMRSRASICVCVCVRMLKSTYYALINAKDVFVCACGGRFNIEYVNEQFNHTAAVVYRTLSNLCAEGRFDFFKFLPTEIFNGPTTLLFIVLVNMCYGNYHAPIFLYIYIYICSVCIQYISTLAMHCDMKKNDATRRKKKWTKSALQFLTNKILIELQKNCVPVTVWFFTSK